MDGCVVTWVGAWVGRRVVDGWMKARTTHAGMDSAGLWLSQVEADRTATMAVEYICAEYVTGWTDVEIREHVEAVPYGRRGHSNICVCCVYQFWFGMVATFVTV